MKMNEIMIYKLKIALGILFLFLLSVTKSRAQQDPTFTQYYFNTQAINPAYAGTWDNTGFLVIGRHQWVGMSGAPTSYTFSFQTPARSQNVAVGLNLIADIVGFEKRFSLNFDYSYRVKITKETALRLGIKGGLTSYSNNLTEYTGYPGDPADPLFMTDINNKIMPNLGIGAFLYNKEFYVGLSSTQIFKVDFKDNYSNYSSWAELQHFYLMGGYVFELSEKLRFKPTFLVRSIFGSSMVVDLTANFLLGEKVWLGANYRTGDSFGFIAQWLFDNKLRIGYAIDYSVTPMRSFSYATHEVMVSYELPAWSNFSTPRMF